MKVTLCAFADEAAKDLAGQLRALRENDVPLLELRNVDGKNVMQLTPDDARRYRQAFDDAGIRVWSLGAPLAKVSETVKMDAYLEKVKNLCAVAHLLGAENVRGFSFYPSLFGFHADVILEKLSVLVRLLGEEGLSFCHENDSGLYGSTEKRVQKLLRALPEMKYVYDPANFLRSGQDPNVTLETLAPKAYYFHFKDADRKRIVPAGFGDGQLDRLIASLGRDTVITVEPHLLLFRGSKRYNQSELYGKFDLKTPRGRFDCAVAATKRLLTQQGFTDCGGYFEKRGEGHETQ